MEEGGESSYASYFSLLYIYFSVHLFCIAFIYRFVFPPTAPYCNLIQSFVQLCPCLCFRVYFHLKSLHDFSGLNSLFALQRDQMYVREMELNGSVNRTRNHSVCTDGRDQRSRKTRVHG